MNVKQIADDFVNTIQLRSSYYKLNISIFFLLFLSFFFNKRHNKLLIPYGDDFTHREAYNSFINMDKLMNYINQNNASYGVTVKKKYFF